MRILLAQPPLSLAAEVTPPVGLCTLAAWLLSCGHDVVVCDLDLEVKTARDGPDGYLGLFEAQLRDWCPDAVGVTSMYNNSLQAERLIALAKRIDDSILTVAGGCHFGVLGDRALRRVPELEVVVQREGEMALAAVLAAADSGVPLAEVAGVCFRAGEGRVIENEPGPLLDLAELPPVWQTVDGAVALERYAATIPRGAERRSVYVEAGRGCPFACTFCATSPFWNRRFRVKPVGAIVDEIRYLHEHLGYDSFMLVHDLLTVGRRFLSELCDAVQASALPVQWMANHRTDLRLTGLLPKMRAAGCWKVFVGVESGSERIQQVTTKRLRTDEVVTSIRELADHGISATCSFIMGFPDETPEELSSTISLGAYLKLFGVETVQFHRLRTWPPAPLARERPRAQFDHDSLQIEYPVTPIPPEDVDAIKADRDFFAGYFAPESGAGTFSEIAQAELFFSQATALAPFTVFALCTMLSDGLIPSFFEHLGRDGRVTRDDFDTATFDLARNWRFLAPRIRSWIDTAGLLGWQRRIVAGLLTYEGHRLAFVTGQSLSGDRVLARSERWTVFESSVDVPAAVASLQLDRTVTRHVLRPVLVAFSRRERGVEVYCLDQSLRAALFEPDSDVVAFLSAASPIGAG